MSTVSLRHNHIITVQIIDRFLSVLMATYPREPGLTSTRMSPFRILLKLRSMEVVSGDNWSYKMCKASVKLSSTTFFHRQMPFLSPNQQCQSTEGKKFRTCINCYYYYRCIGSTGVRRLMRGVPPLRCNQEP